MESLDNILVFKTDLGKLCANCAVAKLLDAEPQITSWTLDADDIDRVLRVESATVAPQYIVDLLRSAGSECSELE